MNLHHVLHQPCCTQDDTFHCVVLCDFLYIFSSLLLGRSIAIIQHQRKVYEKESYTELHLQATLWMNKYNEYTQEHKNHRVHTGEGHIEN